MERERTRAVVNTPATRLCTSFLVMRMVTIGNTTRMTSTVANMCLTDVDNS